ncbi:hypothetical protein SprV_0200638700 [Sparganum proliferum]
MNQQRQCYQGSDDWGLARQQPEPPLKPPLLVHNRIGSAGESHYPRSFIDGGGAAYKPSQSQETEPGPPERVRTLPTEAGDFWSSRNDAHRTRPAPVQSADHAAGRESDFHHLTPAETSEPDNSRKYQLPTPETYVIRENSGTTATERRRQQAPERAAPADHATRATVHPAPDHLSSVNATDWATCTTRASHNPTTKLRFA